MFVESKHILANTKFQSPLDGLSVRQEVIPYTNLRKVPNTSDFESDFLLSKRREYEQKKDPLMLRSGPPAVDLSSGLLSMTDEIDQLLSQFQ